MDAGGVGNFGALGARANVGGKGVQFGGQRKFSPRPPPFFPRPPWGSCKAAMRTAGSYTEVLYGGSYTEGLIRRVLYGGSYTEDLIRRAYTEGLYGGVIRRSYTEGLYGGLIRRGYTEGLYGGIMQIRLGQ